MSISLFCFPLSAMELIAYDLQAYSCCDLQDTVAFLATVSLAKYLFSLGETHSYILIHVYICEGS